MKRAVLAVLLLGAVLFSAAAETRTLTVANWKGYGSDSAYGAVVFEKMYNVKVVHQYFTSLEEMLTMLRAGGMGKIDVLLPNSAFVKVAVDEGLVQAIDTSKISSYGDILKSLREFPDAIGPDGKVYAVPWTWGTTSLGYNPKFVKDAPTSWAALWDPRYAGKVGFFDDYDTAIRTAALYLGLDPQNPDLGKVKDALLALKKNTRTYWASYDDFLKPYAAEEIVIGNMWAGLATKLTNAKQPVVYVHPREGTIGWTDFWAIAKDAPQYDLACKWIDFMVGEKFQLAWATDKDNAHCTVNTRVMGKLTDSQKRAIWIYPNPPAKLAMQQSMNQDQRQAWLDLWNEVKASQ